MHTGILIIAHHPLASALRSGVLHVFPDAADGIRALDVPADEDVAISVQRARQALLAMGTTQTLIMTDVFGATPCNVAQKITEGMLCRILTGVNLPMLLRTVNYRHEALELLVARAIAGGTQSIMQVAVTAPQNQQRNINDQQHHDHSQ